MASWLAAAAVLALPARAQDLYQGKTITIVVGNVASSGVDPYGRVLARHMGRHIPGRPNLIVQNMPGAGSIKAADWTYNIAPKDGTVLTLVQPGALMEPLTGDPAKVRYDATRFEFLGTADVGTRICFTGAASPVKTFADARKTRSIMAATAAGSSLWDYPYFLRSLAGARFDVVSGYPGPADAILAMERGEADGVCGLDVSTLRAVRPDWFGAKRHEASIFLYTAMEPNAELEARGAANIWPFISAHDRPVVEFIVVQQAFQRPFLAPPGTPEPQLRLLRAAFLATWRDPEALEDARRMKLSINPRSGEDVARQLAALYAAPREIIERMAKAIRP